MTINKSSSSNKDTNNDKNHLETNTFMDENNKKNKNRYNGKKYKKE